VETQVCGEVSRMAQLSVDWERRDCLSARKVGKPRILRSVVGQTFRILDVLVSWIEGGEGERSTWRLDTRTRSIRRYRGR
jgi:hypothetical protein